MPDWRWTLRASPESLRTATRDPSLLQGLAAGVWWLDVAFGLAYHDRLASVGSWAVVGGMVALGALHLGLQVAWLGVPALVLPIVRPPTGIGYLLWLWFTPHGRGPAAWPIAVAAAVGLVTAVVGPGE